MNLLLSIPAPPQIHLISLSVNKLDAVRLFITWSKTCFNYSGVTTFSIFCINRNFWKCFVAESERNLLNTCLLFATLSTLAIVIKGSIKLLNSLALGKVVLIISRSISAIAKFLNKAFLWAEFHLTSFLISYVSFFLSYWWPQHSFLKINF